MAPENEQQMMMTNQQPMMIAQQQVPQHLPMAGHAQGYPSSSPHYYDRKGKI